jgi:hypothetical protein
MTISWHAIARHHAVVTALLLMLPVRGDAAELHPETLAAYERYVAAFEREFTTRVAGEPFLSVDDQAARKRELLGGNAVAQAGGGDGIISIENGLIHHWRGAVFIPRTTIEEVLAVAQDFASYARTYDWVIGSRVFARAGSAQTPTYRVLLRLEQSAGPVTGVLDVWSVVTYRRPREDRAAAVSNSNCVRQVEGAGTADERLLPPGMGSGYLWRANTFSKYLERDGGVYVEVDNIGLSRGFPTGLGWIIEPFARRIGRGSVSDSLAQLRHAVRPEGRPSKPAPKPVRLPDFWCAA